MQSALIVMGGSLTPRRPPRFAGLEVWKLRREKREAEREARTKAARDEGRRVAAPPRRSLVQQHDQREGPTSWPSPATASAG